MKSYYEKKREDNYKIAVQHASTKGFPLHFHNNMEVFLVQSGSLQLTLGENKYLLQRGDIAIADSYEIHGYEYAPSDQTDLIVILPFRYLQTFNAKRKNLKIVEPVIHDETLTRELTEIAERYLSHEDESVAAAATDLFLTLLTKRLTFTTNKTKEDQTLVRQILIYLQENFRFDASRRAVARKLGYTEAHISRVFHRFVGKSISEYVNTLRLEYIERLRNNGDDRTTIELIYESGFKSQQTYYRVRKEYFAKTSKF